MTDDDAPSLAELAKKHGTDKEGIHFYARHYEHHLGHLRFADMTVLEIGIGGYSDPSAGGESLRMWKEYFPNGTIVGLDVYDKSPLAEDRIHVVRGSQADRRVLETLGRTFGPFDVIVDDGSHVPGDVIATFRGLFSYLKAGGIYAVEDLQTSYWVAQGGSRTGRGPGTSMRFFLSFANGLNYEEFDIPNYSPTMFDRQIVGVSFHHNLVFVRKGTNEEGSNMLPPHPRAKRQFGLTKKAKLMVGARAHKSDVIGRTLTLGMRVRSRFRRWRGAT